MSQGEADVVEALEQPPAGVVVDLERRDEVAGANLTVDDVRIWGVGDTMVVRVGAQVRITPDATVEPTGGFAVRLDNFEGPFDLLLSLIGKHKMDVTEVALSRVTDEFIAHIKAAGEVYSELNASNADWKKIYADFSAWRRDANLWFRFTEAGFDDFMQAQKL